MLGGQVYKEHSLWQNRAYRAPGTTHACKCFFPEKVYLTAGFETDLAAFCNLFQRELSNLLGQQCSRFVNCGWFRQQLAQTGQTRDGEGPQLVELLFDVGVLRDTAQQTNEIEWQASYLVI